MTKNKTGKIITPPNTNIWPHEWKTAQVLAKYGYTVEFVVKSESIKIHSADALVDGVLWEFKAPEGHRLKVVEKNLRRAAHQSSYIVFDMRRMKKIPDYAVKREIRAKLPYIKGVQKLKFIDRHGRIFNIL